MIPTTGRRDYLSMQNVGGRENMRLIGKKGQIGNLTSVGIALAVFGIVLMVAAIVVSNFQNTNAVWNNTNANQTATRVLTGYSDLTSWLPVIIITIVGALILALVLRAFGGAAGKR
jgi:hypothetical protein